MLPGNLRDAFKIKLVYRYSKTIGRKILNYNQVLRDSGVTCYDDIAQMPCDCDSSPFKHDIFGHVITGDHRLIRDDKLRQLCSFGAKFRENPLLDLHKIKQDVLKSLDNLKSRIARKFSLPASSFKKWRGAFAKNFVGKLMACSQRCSYRLPTLSDRRSKVELDRLRSNYVITVVDKAANNFAFTCKKFYFMKLASELGMDNATPGNETYVHCQDSEAQVVAQIGQDLSRFRIVPDESEEKLALLYQTPKFHKLSLVVKAQVGCQIALSW